MLTQHEGGIAQRLLIAAGLDPRVVRHEIRREAGASDTENAFLSDELPFTPRAYRIMAEAVKLADEHGEETVLDAHILMAMLNEGEGIPIRKLRGMGADLTIWHELLVDELTYESAAAESPFRVPRPEPQDRSIQTTPLLDKFGRDLTALALQGKISPIIGREREIRAVARTLARSKKNNPLLLGDAGVGKTAVVEGLAHHIVNGQAPGSLLGKRIIQIEIGTLLAGTSLRGQFEERLVGILDEARNVPGIILFIDEIHTIVGAGDTIDSNLDAANILKPALSRGELVCIGATTYEEYRKAIAQDTALDRRFRTVEIEEPTPEQTLDILKYAQQQYADHHQVEIRPEALETAVQLSVQYMINRRQPDKALDLLDEACARVVIQTVSDPEVPRVVTADSVIEVLAEWTGIPIARLNEDERHKYQRIEENLKARVIGQDHAIKAVTDAIKTNRAGLSDPNRPVGVFLFLGPSGVGKTELARALAEFLFGSEEALLRFDMSEFHDEHTVARLIGSPPGYKDSQRGGQLTEALRRRPYSVVLLDEVDKAAPEVFDIFLQVFDDGRLTDSRGNLADARHAVWIMTSNIGTSDAARMSLGFHSEPLATDPQHYHTALRKFFRPEFLNRLDDVVVFNSLDREALNGILELQLSDLRVRLSEQKLGLRMEPDACELILNKGYDPANGARPLRRTIERLLTRPLSRCILDDFFEPGTTIVVRASSDGNLSFERSSDS
ncbi:MAG: ATP-dependent Clp protease ATP-binding subunit [Verrucomicrobia subdivision 3 bacterium]|nr:ATP-dependent Clp protease ATP-binding subunit [Limisphaerales bacterium]